MAKAQGNKTAAIIPFEEWERTEKAKDILEHAIRPYDFVKDLFSYMCIHSREGIIKYIDICIKIESPG